MGCSHTRNVTGVAMPVHSCEFFAPVPIGRGRVVGFCSGVTPLAREFIRGDEKVTLDGGDVSLAGITLISSASDALLSPSSQGTSGSGSAWLHAGIQQQGPRPPPDPPPATATVHTEAEAAASGAARVVFDWQRPERSQSASTFTNTTGTARRWNSSGVSGREAPPAPPPPPSRGNDDK